ncbi:MAG: EFR1 family ferrodoxin [Elusimicrobiota bacterium]
MKTKLFYFSGTGNSLKIARDLANELGDTEIVAINKVINDDNIDLSASNIGIVFPVYIWGLPLIVERFAKKLDVPKTDNLETSKNKYLFAIANYGGFQGGAILQTKKIFDKKGIVFSAGFGVKMPGNYTPLYGAIPVEKQMKLFEKEKTKIKYIAECIKNKSKIIEKDILIMKWIFHNLLYKIFASHIPEEVKNFWADDKCNGCGICEKICPVKNIKITDDKPKWGSKCEQCFACLQWCPIESIQFGKKTSTRKRYRCPEISAVDFF